MANPASEMRRDPVPTPPRPHRGRAAALGLLGALLASGILAGSASGAVSCVVDGTTMTVTVSGAEEVSVSAPDSQLAVNGVPCGNATVQSVQTIRILEAAGANADQDLELDLGDGPFSSGSTEIQIEVELGGGEDSLTVRGSSGSDTLAWGSAGIALNEGDTLDVLVARADALSFRRLQGGDGNDLITGLGGHGSGSAALHALDLRGGDGDDRVAGGNGDDEVRGDLGDDTITGGEGVDTVTFGAADAGVTANLEAGTATGDGLDTIREVENLTGSQFADALVGDASENGIKAGKGDDTVSGGAGDDGLLGDDGNDALSGGDGDDVLRGGLGDDTLSGDTGIDTASYAGADGAIEADLVLGSATGGAGRDGLSSIENVLGLDHADTLRGGPEANSLRGKGGDDRILGGGGADLAHGEDGNDVLRGGTGADVVHGDAGDDMLLGEIGTDRVEGGAGTDVVRGGPGNDRVEGGTGFDRMLGDAGQDRLLARDRGRDRVDGGAGKDRAEIDRRLDVIRRVETLV